MDTETIVYCERCGARCKVDGSRNPDAKMLRRSKKPKGLCVNCAVHDWLRKTYPCNMILASSGPRVLAYQHIRDQFADIMRTAGADADPDEINWNLINENWDLPFADKVKPRADNPITQKEFDEIRDGKYKAIDTPSPAAKVLLDCNGVITSFEQLNQLEPGLGDQIKNLLPNSKEKIMSKKQKGEQLRLIEVGPENLKVIAKETRIYRSLVDQRLVLLKKEVKQKEKVKTLVKEAELQRLQDGRIQFEVDDEIVCLMPQDDLITIKKKTPKKPKKGMKKRVETEEKKFEDQK